MKFLKYMIIPVLIFAPEFSYSQHIEWEVSHNIGQYELIQGIALTPNKDIIAVGYSENQPRMLKTDSLGNILWIKNLIGDTLEDGYYNFIKDIPGEPGYYYAGAYASESLPVTRNNDVLMKIDTAGDTLWTKKYYYPTFYSTLRDAIVLKDKSIITTGEILDASGVNIIARRIDSVGNTLWENVYSLPEDQFGLRIIEMMDGSLLISGRHSNRKYSFLKIRFDGTYIDHGVVPSIRNSQYGILNLSLLPNNHLAMTALSISGLDDIGHFIQLDENLDTVKNLEYGNAITLGPLILEDSNYFFNYLTYQNDWKFFISDSNLITFWDTVYGSYQGTLNSHAHASAFSDQDLFLGGLDYTTQNGDYWLAKIKDVGNRWIPDRCAYQPPRAGFEYEYNYPLLTLRDTSSGGLKYLDTIYTWQWNTSNGISGTDDSLLVFFDTANSNTLNVELIISNWYGCIDTINETLDFTPTGIVPRIDFDVSIWPNPTSDMINVQLSEKPQTEVVFEIYDVHGTRVKSETFIGSKLSSEVHGLSSGMYFYKLSSQGRVKRGKIVKF